MLSIGGALATGIQDFGWEPSSQESTRRRQLLHPLLRATLSSHCYPFPLSDAPTPVEFGVFGSVSLLDTLWVHGRVVAYLPPSSFSLSLLLYCCLSHSARLLGDCSARACPALFLLLTPAYFTLCVRPCMCKQLFSRALSTLLLVSDVFSFFFFIILPLSCWCCCCRGFFSFG